jgi:hypothetical protein
MKKNPDLKPDLKPDNLSQHIRLSQQDPNFIVVQGILAEDEDKDKVKVYLNYELNTYVRIPVKSILQRERTKDEDGLELSILHVGRNVELEVVQIIREQVESDFLSKALITASDRFYPSIESDSLAFTPATRTITLATRYLCPRTPRLTVTCTMVCTFICPNPWTKNWFC